MSAVPRRLAALFLVALLGVLAAFGLVAHAVGGAAALTGYLLVVAALLGVLVVRARALVRGQRAVLADEAGRTCTCCTSSQHDPVRVV